MGDLFICLRCKDCGHLFLNMVTACSICGCEQLEEKILSGYGKVVTFTTVLRAPECFQAPYILAVIELEEGKQLLGRLDLPKDIKIQIGQRVKYLQNNDFGRMFECFD